MLQPGPSVLNGHHASQAFPDGDVCNAQEWGVELSQYLTDRKSGKRWAALVTYALPIDGLDFLVGHSLSPVADGLMRLVLHKDYGDEVGSLVQQHLPTLYEAITSGWTLASGCGLVRVRTGRDHWFFGGVMTSASNTSIEFSNEDLAYVRMAAFAAMHQAVDYHLRIPGLVQVLGGPTRWARRMSVIGSFLNLATDLGGALTGGGVSVADGIGIYRDVCEVTEKIGIS